VLRAACLARCAARCTTLLTVTATVTNSSSASRLFPSAIVSVCTGGVKYQLTSRLAITAANTAGQNPPITATATTATRLDEQVVAEVQVQATGGQGQGEQWQPGDEQRPGGYQPADADAAGQVRNAAVRHWPQRCCAAGGTCRVSGERTVGGPAGRADHRPADRTLDRPVHGPARQVIRHWPLTRHVHNP